MYVDTVKRVKRVCPCQLEICSYQDEAQNLHQEVNITKPADERAALDLSGH